MFLYIQSQFQVDLSNDFEGKVYTTTVPISASLLQTNSARSRNNSEPNSTLAHGRKSKNESRRFYHSEFSAWPECGQILFFQPSALRSGKHSRVGWKAKLGE